MMRITLALGLAVFLGGMVHGETPSYLYGTFALPQGAFATLPERAQTAGIPLAVAGEGGVLSFVGADSEADLLAGGRYLYLDGAFFLLGFASGGNRAFLRGCAREAELILIGDLDTVHAFLDLLGDLGLLPAGGAVELERREIPAKVPAPPSGVRLDPVLWGLLLYPDWFAFAGAHGIERVGLRVRVVAEVTGLLPEGYEPYIQGSSDGLVQLLLPIPLLDDLAGEEVVVRVRPPHIPHPLVPGRP
ncbi:hypothetical protein ACVNPS_01730 [Candidatus Bipolaricaulota sp. J31]